MNGGAQFEIRPARSHADLHACVEMQAVVWHFAPADVVPFHQLLTAHEWGGQVLVAVDGDRVVGFSYAFSGRQYGRPALLSHMLAVLPEYRGQDLGAGLKLAQARWALANGYDLITWTFDPLQAINANLNIGRLGGIVRQYLVNHYGELTDEINQGLPSDRLLLEWHLRHPRVTAILAGERPAPAAAARTCAIVRNMGALKRADPAEALRVQRQVREELRQALAGGYVITGFQLAGQTGTYLLSKEAGEA